MLARIRRLFSQFFQNAQTINSEPVNKVSLIVLIIVDIFILVNVFTGLDDISRWHLGPSEAYPCYGEWSSYRANKATDRDYQLVAQTLENLRPSPTPGFQASYQQAQVGHLGSVAETCISYGAAQDQINNSTNQKTRKTLEQSQTKISTLEQSNEKIRTQYDSTLIEKLAGQAREQSINAVGAEKAKQTLEQNNREIASLKQATSNLKQDLMARPEVQSFITLLQNDAQFLPIEQGYQQATFWYPSIQLGFQMLFLLPLILVALWVHNQAQRRGHGLIALISWHLLAIFFIPLIIKVFEFLQIGFLFRWLSDLINFLFQGLRFLINYLYILLIPAIGFAIIKFFQTVIFNPKAQATSRVQKSRCLRCARKIQRQDLHCPHCGYEQYTECSNCHNLTHKHLAYCRECGFPQNN
jgi:predicted RNA-binding Zn-ribbon protein involved in translation (DUF1610 family)